MAARKRHDPPSTAADGYRPFDRLQGFDPNRHYVYANPNDEQTGVDFYLSLGYELERYRPDGPRPIGGKDAKDGEIITRLGQHLVSCPMEDRTATYAAEQAEADRFDRRVLKDGNIDDPMRGRRRGHSIGVDPRETEWSQPKGA